MLLKTADECRSKQTPLGRAAWIEVPCKTITRQTLSKHIESNCHKEAMSIESIHVLVETHEELLKLLLISQLFGY